MKISDELVFVHIRMSLEQNMVLWNTPTVQTDGFLMTTSIVHTDGRYYVVGYMIPEDWKSTGKGYWESVILTEDTITEHGTIKEAKIEAKERWNLFLEVADSEEIVITD